MNEEQKQVTAEEQEEGSFFQKQITLLQLQARIAELEAINSQYKKQITELNQSLSDECRKSFKLISRRDKCRGALEEGLTALRWMLDNMSVVDKSLQADAFNIPMSAIVQAEQALNQKEGKCK